MGRPTFICGPPDSRCYVYGTLVAETHVYSGKGSRSAHEHGEGPLCERCGVPKGTIDWEVADDDHRRVSGHGLTYCENEGDCETATRRLADTERMLR